MDLHLAVSLASGQLKRYSLGVSVYSCASADKLTGLTFILLVAPVCPCRLIIKVVGTI